MWLGTEHGLSYGSGRSSPWLRSKKRLVQDASNDYAIEQVLLYWISSGRMEEINRHSTAQGRGRLHALIWRASSYRRSTEQGRRRLHAPSWRVARPPALDEAGPRPPRQRESPATTVSSALQPCRRDREDIGVASPKERIDPAAPKELVAALATATATSRSDGEGGARMGTWQSSA